MTIALDATPLAVSTGGVPRYTTELALALARAYPDDRYWMVSDQDFEMPQGAPPGGARNLAAGGKPRNFAERKWWIWGLNRELRRLGVEVFHGTDFSVPYSTSMPAVMTLHDLSPWLDAGWQRDATRVRRRTPWLLRAGFATMVITHSEAVRRTVVDRFRLDPERVVAVPLASAANLRPVPSPPPERPYFLFVGTLEPRKNVARLIDAWREVRTRHEVDLVLAGRVRSDFAAPAPEPGLRMLGAVAEEQLAPLYSGAIAVVYPSLYEGFGLPVLEAMQCGAVVITSRDPAVTEVAEGAAVQVDALDTRALAEAMEAVVRAPQDFADLRARGVRRAAEFSWERTARLTREVYAAAIRFHA